MESGERRGFESPLFAYNGVHMVLKTSIIIILMGLFQLLPAGAEEPVGSNKDQQSRKSEPKVINAPAINSVVGLGCTANTKDAFITSSFGMNLFPRYNLLGGLLFYARPYKKSIFEEITPNNYYQYKELRFVLGISAEKLFFFNNDYGLFIMAAAAYTFGVYGGTERSAENSFTPIASAGFLWYMAPLMVKAGYQYIQAPQIPDNRGYFEIMYLW
jgi:hypothetical protein